MVTVLLLNGQELKNVPDADLVTAYKTADQAMTQAIQNEVSIRRQLRAQSPYQEPPVPTLTR
jgi:hypothetical protein